MVRTSTLIRPSHHARHLSTFESFAIWDSGISGTEDSEDNGVTYTIKSSCVGGSLGDSRALTRS